MSVSIIMSHRSIYYRVFEGQNRKLHVELFCKHAQTSIAWYIYLLFKIWNLTENCLGNITHMVFNILPRKYKEYAPNL